MHVSSECSVVIVVDTELSSCETSPPTRSLAGYANPSGYTAIIFTMLTSDSKYYSTIFPVTNPSPSLPLSRKEFRFAVDPTLTIANVVSKIREQTGLKSDASFNLKWLDVEGALL